MLRHALPTGDDAAILDRALTALLTELARKKFGATERPGPARQTSPSSRQIPAAVKRTVWIRDLGSCAYKGPDGRRCSERAFIEFHHVRPFAIGGEPTVSNIELRSRRHNRYEAKVFFPRPDLCWNEAPSSQRGSERCPGCPRRGPPTPGWAVGAVRPSARTASRPHPVPVPRLDFPLAVPKLDLEPVPPLALH